jgi:parallel beta-helix repeat protein
MYMYRVRPPSVLPGPFPAALALLLTTFSPSPSAHLFNPAEIDSVRPEAGDHWIHRDALEAVFVGDDETHGLPPTDTLDACGGGVPCPCGGRLIESLTLEDDLIGCGGLGIFVEDDSLVLDCGGHAIEGTGVGTGIWISGARGVTIRNCDLRSFRVGLLAQDADRLVVQGNRFTNNLVSALWAAASSRLAIEGNHFRENGRVGIGQRIGAIATLKQTNHSRIKGNSAAHNGNPNAYVGGIVLFESTRDSILENTLFDTGEDNIWIRFGWGRHLVARNSIDDSGMDGIWIRESDDNVVEGNIITNIDLYGIYVRGGRRNAIRGNLIDRAGRRAAGGIGIGGYEFPSTDNIAEGNEVRSSPQGLVVHEHAHDNVFSENLLSGNGIGVFAGHGLIGLPNRVVRTTIEESTNLDVAMYGRENTLQLVGSAFEHDLVRLACLGGVCRIEIRWFVSLRVEDDLGRPIEAAEATLRDVFGNLVFAGTSGTDGSFPVFEATDYVLDRDGKTEHNDHVLEVRKECFEPDTVGLWIDGDLFRTVVLAQNPVLSVAAGTAETEFTLAVSPNPIRSRTTVRFSLPSPERARLEVYDVRGRLTARVADRAYPAGLHSADWIIANVDRQKALSPGTYFIRLVAGDRSITKKISVAGE